MPDSRRRSSENCSKVDWADRLTGALAVSNNSSAQTARLPGRASVSIKLRKFGPREIGAQNGLVVLPRPRPSDGTPLAQPHAVPGARTGGHEPAHEAVLFGDI